MDDKDTDYGYCLLYKSDMLSINKMLSFFHKLSVSGEIYGISAFKLLLHVGR